MKTRITTLQLGYENKVQYTLRSTQLNIPEALEDLTNKANEEIAYLEDDGINPKKTLVQLKYEYELFELGTALIEIMPDGTAVILEQANTLDNYIPYTKQDLVNYVSEFFTNMENQLIQSLPGNQMYTIQSLETKLDYKPVGDQATKAIKSKKILGQL